jgi:DNA-binding NarL/FixJ family response regulator
MWCFLRAGASKKHHIFPPTPRFPEKPVSRYHGVHGMNDKIRVLLVDDQRLMREGLRILLELEADIDVIGEAEDGLQAVQFYEKLTPDVVLMDIRMPKLDGVEATRRICARWPKARIIILTTFDDDQDLFEGLRVGALGYLLKDLSGAELAEAIRTVMEGGALIEPSVARKVLAEFSRLAPPTPKQEQRLLEPLSEREQEIIRLLSQGLTNRQIAARLHLAEGTVKNYVSSILQKLEVEDRTQAAIRAHDLGLLD